VHCATWFTARVPEPAESLDYSAYYHAGNLDVPPFVLGRLEERVSSFERARRLNRWIDVGCGAGTLLQAARNRGWEVVGTEVAHGAAEAVRAKGFDVREGELRELDLASGDFDVVSMVEVLEHVPEPRVLLVEACKLLRPGGLLYATTPHGRGISARLLRTRWSVVAPPEHLQLFSLSGLRFALGEAGFAVRELRTHVVNPRELLEAVRPRQEAAAVSRVDSGYHLNEALSARRSGRALKSAANAALAASRLGDSIRLVAERPA
jgi:SAM-dependent methyltransferase